MARITTATDLRKKSDADLLKLLDRTRAELSELSFKAASRQLKEVAKIRVHKRTIARLLTVLRERRTNS